MTVDGTAAADEPLPPAPKPPPSAMAGGFAPAADRAAPAPEKAAAARPSPEGNVKDTVESILVAFILAFVFRAFVVEAFVIPTGSMAPTLLGAHMQVRCADCGYDFAVNYPTSKAGNDLAIPPESQHIGVPIVCPNCGYQIPNDGPPDGRTDRAPVHYGDRILVLKYRYLFGGGPKRWDVVVFKSPDPVPPSPLYTTNYIKRLIGRPGESVMMLDGDIYVSTAAAPPADADDAARKAFLKTFQIQRKPGYAQDALWRVVYDNDHLPHLSRSELPGSVWRQPWEAKPADGAKAADGATAASGWDVGQSLDGLNRGRVRAFRFANANGAGAIEFNPDANPDTHAFTDFIAYDQYSEYTTESGRTRKNTVSDLHLSAVYRREAGDGPLDLSMSKRDDLFTARLTPGQAVLTRTNTRTGQLFAYPAVAVPELTTGSSAGAKLDFTNVDYRVSLKVNGREVIATGDEYGPAGDAIVALEQAEQDESRAGGAPRPTVRIAADRQTAALEHVALTRDVFYINDRNTGSPGRQSLRASPDDIVTLGAEEYFVLGDNGLISGDARVWQNAVRLPGEDLPYVAPGRVPSRFLLGKAFFVYWPAGHRPMGSSWGLVPNFGDMRFIH